MNRIVIWAWAFLVPLPASLAQDKDKKPGTDVAAKLQAIKDDISGKRGELIKEFKAAKTEEERDKIQNRFFEILAAALGQINQVVEQNAKDPAADEARRMLNQILNGLSSSDSPAIAKHLQTLMEKSTDKAIKGQAGIALARTLSKQAEKTYARDKEAAAKTFATAEATLTALEKQNQDLAAQVKDALFEIKNLSVGKTAMDIDGEDIDGKKFKLSDYRGKVVVLDFWGHW